MEEKHQVQTNEEALVAGEAQRSEDRLPMDGEGKNAFPVVSVVYVFLVGLGIVTGFLLSRTHAGLLALPGGKPTYVNTGKVAGITDEKTFKDSAEGVLEKGGLDGEGTHKLIRDGGPSQTAYLNSSSVDLDIYIGKRVKVWGETFAAQKASWLMDVGKIEVQ